MDEGVMIPVEVVRKELREAKIIEVTPDLYRAVRSFVESSTKPKYSWNTGIKSGNTIMFIKPNKWELTVDLSIRIPEQLECPIWLRSLLQTWKGIHICFKKEKDPIYNRDVINMYVSFDPLHEPVKFESLDDFNLYLYSIYSPVMFARHITLHEIVQKINKFVDLEKYRAELEKVLTEQQVATA